jgi:cell division protein FtsI/penicillin-binding protein 2
MDNYQRWRQYQKKLQRKDLQRKRLKQSLWLFSLLVGVVLAVQFSKTNLSIGWLNTSSDEEHRSENGSMGFGLFGDKDLASLIDTSDLLNGPDGTAGFRYSGKAYSVETTLDADLQGYMTRKIEAARSPLIGFVAIDPTTGHVVTMIDRKITHELENVGQSSTFPAASIFKIISATAAIDRGNLSADSTLTYNGRSHTLYKNQLKNGSNRYTNSVSLKDSFAKSINPAFGKLGVFCLKKDLLAEYALRFGFNQPINFELPVEPSRFSIDDDPYHWAEIACGFNRDTLISPIHGAMIASAVVNGGKLVEPKIVKHITDSKRNLVYSGGDRVARQVMSPETSQEMMTLMAATISQGTSKRAFRGYRRDRVLSNLVLGGKTGSIKNETDKWLYDWFVGYGAEKAGSRKLALAVLVVHGELLRARAHEYARLALKYYFGRS